MKIKSLDELASIREKMKDEVAIRHGNEHQFKVVVAMGTCGIAAGARPVLNALYEDVENASIFDKVTVTQSGCVGNCQLEPIVEVYEQGKEKVTYVNMTVEKAKRVVDEHLVAGNVVKEFLAE